MSGNSSRSQAGGEVMIIGLNYYYYCHYHYYYYYYHYYRKGPDQSPWASRVWSASSARNRRAKRPAPTCPETLPLPPPLPTPSLSPLPLSPFLSPLALSISLDRYIDT